MQHLVTELDLMLSVAWVVCTSFAWSGDKLVISLQHVGGLMSTCVFVLIDAIPTARSTRLGMGCWLTLYWC